MQTTHEQLDVPDDHGLRIPEKELIQDFAMHLKLIDDSYLEEAEDDDHEFLDKYEDSDGGDYGEDDHREDDEEEEEEEEFSFMSEGTNPSSAGADDGLNNDDDSKSVFPWFNRSLLFPGGGDEDPECFPMSIPVKKVFMETNEADRHVTSVTPASDEIAGPCCEWSAGKGVGESSSSACKKSNSTGFSKIWRLKEFIGRSSSDGKDVFVILNKALTPPPTPPPQLPKAGPRKVKEGGRSKTAAAVAHEAYLKSKERVVGGKRRTYLPYRPELIGFFTNANVGFTKNVHPY